MYVIDVIPFSRTAPGLLSYRSSKKMSEGTVVEIMLRKTKTHGIVVSCTHVEDAKEMIKHARFTLSKSSPSPAGRIDPRIVKALKEVANFHATSLGSVLTALFSEHIQTDVEFSGFAYKKNGNDFKKVSVEKSIDERAKEYQKRIEEIISKNKSALLVVPTMAEALFWKETFRSSKPLVLSGALVGKKRQEALQKASSYSGLIIATPSFSWTPIKNLELIIVERVSAGTYVLPKRPYISIVRSLDALARALVIELWYGDYPIPLEYRESATKALPSSKSSISIIDVRRDKNSEKDTAPWRALPPEILERIGKEIENEKRVIIFTARRGYAPAVVCKDCGQSVVDERGLPLSFSQSNGERLFTSSDGKTTIPAAIHCERCGSWNLLPLGVGQERVEEELRNEFPGAVIVLITAEDLRTPAKARALLRTMHEPGTITIGTESLLPWLLPYAISKDDRPLGIIASADSLLALPFWRARERFVRFSLLTASVCSELLLLTRRPEDSAVQVIENPNSATFLKEESELRRILHFPPYGTLITLTIEGSAHALDTLTAVITSIVSAYNPVTLSDQKVTSTSMRRVFVIMRNHKDWPDGELYNAITSLPASVRVRIDPESIW